MGQITIDQSHGIVGILATHVDWTQVDFEQAKLQDFVMRNPQQAGNEFLRFLQNGCRVQVIGSHIIDCDAVPFIPNGLAGIEHHKKGGQLHWNPANFKLWLHPKQVDGVVDGHELHEWLADKPVYNACVLDYWLAHPEIIPPECKGKWTYFPGTTYCDSNGSLFVRDLYWNGERPVSDCSWLGRGWDADGPAGGSAS